MAKIKHWILLEGKPLAAANTRADLRKIVKCKKANGAVKNGFWYTGKCVEKNGKQHLILEA